MALDILIPTHFIKKVMKKMLRSGNSKYVYIWRKQQSNTFYIDVSSKCMVAISM